MDKAHQKRTSTFHNRSVSKLKHQSQGERVFPFRSCPSFRFHAVNPREQARKRPENPPSFINQFHHAVNQPCQNTRPSFRPSIGQISPSLLSFCLSFTVVPVRCRHRDSFRNLPRAMHRSSACGMHSSSILHVVVL